MFHCSWKVLLTRVGYIKISNFRVRSFTHAPRVSSLSCLICRCRCDGRGEDRGRHRSRDRLQVFLGQVLLEPGVNHRHVLLVPLNRFLLNNPKRLPDDGVRRLEFILMICVELAHHGIALMRIEGRRGGIDDAVPEVSLILESLLYGIPVLL